MTAIIIRIINALAVAALLVGTAALLAALSPALAGDRPLLTPRERDERIAGCIMTHGRQYRDRCVEILEDPAALGRRARRAYEWRMLTDEIERGDRCRDDPRLVSPRACFEGFGRSR